MSLPTLIAGMRTWVLNRDPTASESTGTSGSGAPFAPIAQWDIWINSSTGAQFFCSDPTPDALVWIRSTQIQSDWTQATSGSADFIKNKPTLSAVALSGSYADLLNKPASRSQSSASRSLNSAFQISASRDCLVNYSVDVSCTLSLTTGQTGTVFLEVASDSGFTQNVQEICRFVNANSGTLTIGLNLVQAVTGTLSGFVPSGYYCRMRTANTVGTPSFTWRSGQEILL